MLEPQNRRMLLDLLRPPPDSQLDFAIGTTFSLDLLAMMTAPLGFTLHGLEGSPSDVLDSGDPLLVLQTLRKYASRIGIFCQGGRIIEPKGRHLLFTMLEQSVFEVMPPIAGGVFHPKVWVLRFIGDEGAVTYRVLCLSRNLTFDRSWDTSLVLDGELVDRKVAFARNHPLADFVAALPAMCVRQPASERILAMIATAGRELRRVNFALPPGIDEIVFWPLGLAGKRQDPFEYDRVDRVMVVSPFLSSSKLSEIAEWGGPNVLVSRYEALGQLSASQLGGWDEVFAMNTGASVGDEESTDAPDDSATLTGLHAKLYVGDAGWNSSIWTGSANATRAAFDKNVEFLVQLTGRKSVCGIDAFLSRTDGSTSLRDLIEPFIPAAAPAVPNAADEALDHLLDEVRLRIAKRHWRVEMVALDDAGFSMRAFAEGGPIDLPSEVQLRAWPITLPSSSARILDPVLPTLDFGTVAFETVTSFITIEATAATAGHSRTTRFVLNAELTGAPAGRAERLLHSMLKDRRQVLRFLLLLLSGDDSQAVGAGLGQSPIFGAGTSSLAGESQALLEPLLRALDRDPGRLDEVRTLVEELGSSEEGRQLLPDDLDAIWKPIWDAHTSTRK